MSDLKIVDRVLDWWDRPNVMERTKRKLAMAALAFAGLIAAATAVGVTLANWFK